jgi:hypothetical protein
MRSRYDGHGVGKAERERCERLDRTNELRRAPPCSILRLEEILTAMDDAN